MSRPLKPHLSFVEQVQHLAVKGLVVDDPERARHVLSRVNYYHLRGYYTDLVDELGNFVPGATFGQLVRRYTTDCALREALFPYLREAEQATRVACSYVLTRKYGPIGYLDPAHFEDLQHHHSFLGNVESAIDSSREPFLEVYEQEYGGQYPLWVVVELLSFGTISKLYKNMLPSDQKAAARLIGFQYDALENLLKTLVVLRNLVAHHSRLYGRRMAAQFAIPHQTRVYVSENLPGFTLFPNSVFAAVLGLSAILTPPRRRKLIADIRRATETNDDYRLIKLGFPPGWEDLIEASARRPDRLHIASTD
ncbi:Abi family protein [Arcanobacterium haemolyticum]|nr:Abi family protein [Arcanobacterium haemolyticum]